MREDEAQTTVEVPQFLGSLWRFRRCSSWTSSTRPLCATTDAGVVAWARPVFGQVRYMSAVEHFFTEVVDVPVVLCNGVLQGQFIYGYDVSVFTRRL